MRRPRRFLRSRARTTLVLVALAHALPALARAQGGDAGNAATAQRLDATERRLYEAARRAPRDARARAALGEWLASRGQLRSGAVLLEEARLFGGDASALAGRLRPIYVWLRDWESLAALPASPLTADEKARAMAMAKRISAAAGADSTVVPFAPLELGALGRIPMVIGADTVWVDVDPAEEGLVLPGLGRSAGRVEMFGADRRGPIGVVRDCRVGDLMLKEVPLRIDPALGAGRARLGLDVWASMAPTVDARAGTVTLRRDGRVSEGASAVPVPMLLGFPGMRLALRGGEELVPVTSPAGRAALRGSVWTLDVRRGVVWLRAPR